MRKQINQRLPGLRMLMDIFIPVCLLSLALNLTGLPAWVRVLMGALAGWLGCRTAVMMWMAVKGVRRDEQAQGIHTGGEKQHGVAVYAIVGPTGAIAVESQGCVELTLPEKMAALRCVADYAGSAADAMVEAT